ncbi:MAG: bifunctional riboflavin kinase/FAD synthetase [Candidatus Pelagibacter sp.]
MVRKIKTYENFNISKNHENSIMLVGNFDGLHLGHQKLFKMAKLFKKKYKLKIGVLTFEPMPKMFFKKQKNDFRIASLKQKNSLLSKQGVDFIINKKFDLKFSKTNAHNFIRNVLSKKLKISFLFVSNNFRFGNKRKGNVKLLKNNQKNFNYKVIEPKPLKIKKRIISSSLIRNLLRQGKLTLANKYLSREWQIVSVVKKGRQIGKKMGFPTCNMNIEPYVIAKPGVYAVKIKRLNSNKTLRGIANLGIRPTFNQKKILLEVHIFNFSGNLYNKELIIDFVYFIRKEKKFKSINQLKKQISSDLKTAKNKLN